MENYNHVNGNLIENQTHDQIKEPYTNSMDMALKRSLMPKNKLAIIVQGTTGMEYCCVECPAKYSDKEKLELHLVMHNKEYRFLCGICGTGLKRKEHLDRHTLGHQEVRPHICPECGKGFKRKEHLNIHRSIHSGDKSQVCPLCHRSFYRKDHLQKHLQTHSKLFLPFGDQEMMDIKSEVDEEDIKPILTGNGNCEIVMKIEEENPLLVARPVDHERPFACELCDKTYKRKDHLKMHSATHMKKDKLCSQCGKGFHREDQLLSHMSVHLKPNGYQDHGEQLSPMQDLLEHTNIEILPMEDSLLVPRVNHSAESRPHECPICHRKFKRKQHLKVHANVHMKQQPQQQPTIWCSLCEAGFQSNLQFESHECMTANHCSAENYAGEPLESVPQDAKKENNYPPEFVEMLVPEDEPYDHSQQTMFAVEERHIPTPLRVYVCKFCSKPFKRKDHYKIHLHIHTGVKSFFCPDCGKGFYRKDHLQKHSIVHQKGKPRPRKEMPELFPISMLPIKKEVKPEITITAPSNTKLRVPLQIKVPYQMVMSMDNGEQHAVTIDPAASRPHEIAS